MMSIDSKSRLEREFSSILIIDDEVKLASKLRIIFQFEGINAKTCHDPEQASALASVFQPDVVLLDLNFGSGKRNGLQVLLDLLEASPESCVLMYTGYGDISKAVEAMHAGAWDMIEKGTISPLGLTRIVRERFNRKRELEVIREEKRQLEQQNVSLETARQLASGIVHDAAHRVQELMFHWDRVKNLVPTHGGIREIASEARASLEKLDETLTILRQFSEIPMTQMVPVQVMPIVNASIEDCKKRMRLISDQEISIRLLGMEADVRIENNEQLLGMAFLALLQNACESQTNNGEIIVRLDVSYGFLTISITDKGLGIPPEVLPKIGTGSFTTKGSAGTGLGVLFAKAVASRSQGTFELKNNSPPPGATAIMRFPLFLPK
jgi:signal transduction histidine kinase